MINSLLSIKITIITTALLLFATISVVTTNDMQQRKQSILQQKIDNLENAYKVGISRFEMISDNSFEAIIKREDILNLLYKAKHAKDQKSLTKIRKQLFVKINPHFERLKKFGVIITLFSFENNKTFLRVHKPNKFNDDLSAVRYSFTYVNSNKKSVRGFEQGKISHAFRNIYPIFYHDEYLGSVDIAFSSEVLQKDMETLHNTDTHFILNKDLFKANIWKMQGLSQYVQSLEHTHFLYTLSKTHQESEFAKREVELNKVLKEDIYKNIQHNNEFALNDNDKIVAFLPIKNIKDKKTVAYLVSYTKSLYLGNVLKEYYQINTFAFIILLLLSIVTYMGVKKRILLTQGLEKDIEDQNKAFEVIFEKASDGVFIYENNRIIQCNESIVKMFGFTDKNQVINKRSSDVSPIYQPDGIKSMVKAQEMLELTLKNGSNNFEWKFKTTNEDEFWASVTLTKIKLKNKNVIHALIRDISSQKELEQDLINQKIALNYKAFHDTLTLLPNRALFQDRLSQSIKSANRNKESFALMFIDLDKFKPINDTLGHQIGDKVLQEVAKRLKQLIREEDTLARIGGDEFTILMQKLNTVNNVSKLAQTIISTLEEPIYIEQHTLNISASIGISLYPNHSTNFDDLILYADTAMYKAKNEGRNNFQIYSPDMSI